MTQTMNVDRQLCRTDALNELIKLESTPGMYSLTFGALKRMYWTDTEVYDLIIDEELLPAAPGVHMSIKDTLNPEELRTRRVVRSQLAVVQGLQDLKASIDSLKAEIVAGRGAVPAGGAKPGIAGKKP